MSESPLLPLLLSPPSLSPFHPISSPSPLLYVPSLFLQPPSSSSTPFSPLLYPISILFSSFPSPLFPFTLPLYFPPPLPPFLLTNTLLLPFSPPVHPSTLSSPSSTQFPFLYPLPPSLHPNPHSYPPFLLLYPSSSLLYLPFLPFFTLFSFPLPSLSPSSIISPLLIPLYALPTTSSLHLPPHTPETRRQVDK